MRKRLTRACAVVTIALIALTACSSLVVRDTPFEITGGNRAGVYYNYGDQLAQAMSRDLGMNVAVIESQGSVENLQRVGSGRALVGFAQGDTSVDALRGQGSFTKPLPIRAVARVYDEYVHVVVRAGSDVESIADLAGRRISLGAPSSGVQVIAARVLGASGIGPGAVTNAALGLDESIEAMIRGDIDGFFWVGGLPTPGIERLMQSMPIRMLPIDAETVDRVNEGHAGVYKLADFPADVYDLGEPVVTMTVPNYLVTSEVAPDAVIYDVLRELFDSRAAISKHVAAAGLLDRRQAIFTSPIELHPGAERFFIETRY